jgi:DNA-binding transcriptional LysR family regulator
MSICEDAGFTPKVSHKSVHAHTIFRLVENYLGIAIVPTSLREGFAMDVKFIPMLMIPQRAVLSMVWKKDHRNKALDHCISLLIDEGLV